MTTSRLRKTVYGHYARHGRRLPWRETRDPYRILVSEIMLQQTQVSRVVEKYRLFVRKFPTVRSLAAAPLRDVLGAWQGLGYNRRALALKRAAAEICARHGGKVPRDREALRSLPGIGEATSGSILAFAFNEPVVFIETNIRSVYIHHFFAGRHGVSDEELVPLVEKTLDRRSPARWYNALMDYGVYLKEKLPNPSRKSSRHRAQPRFEGSVRQVRGSILRLLTARGSMARRELGKALGGRDERLARAMSALKKEGLIRERGDTVAVA